MTMNNPLDILRQFSPQASGVMNAVQSGSNVLTQGVNRGIAQDQNARQGALAPVQLQQQNELLKQQQMQTQGLEQQQNISNTVNRLQILEQQIGAGATAQQLAGTLEGFMAESKANGGNSIDSQQAMQALQEGGVKGLVNVLGQAKQVFQQQGFMAAPKTASIDFAKIDPSKFTQESVAAAEQSGRYSDLVAIGDPSQEPAFVGELRKELRTDVGKLEKDAAVLKTNFNKLGNLAEEMRAGNRSAVAQGLVALVKLGDPGSVVREEELKQALGAQSPTAAIADLLRDKGTSEGIINSIVQSMDPLNPASVNVDQVLQTAEAMLQPNIQTLGQAYGAAKDRSGQLTEGGRLSIFSESRDGLFSDLSTMTFGVESTPNGVIVENHAQWGTITEDDITATMNANNMTREQVLNQLGL